VSRHSIKNATRLARGTRSAIGRAQLLYGKRSLIARRLKRALDRLNEAEAELKEAIALAWAENDAARRAA
jgi:hypothetical protein